MAGLPEIGLLLLGVVALWHRWHCGLPSRLGLGMGFCSYGLECLLESMQVRSGAVERPRELLPVCDHV